MTSPCSGVILADAGRIKNSDQTETRLSDILAVFGPLFEDIIVVATDPAAFLELDALIVADHYVPASLWSGVHAGLFAARHAHAFVTACGLPMATTGLVNLFRGAIAPRYDAVLPQGEHAPLPLPGVYAKSCLKPLARQLAKGDSKNGLDWLCHVRVHTLAPAMLHKAVAGRDAE